MEDLQLFINNNFISPDGGEIKSQDLQELKTQLKHILQQIHSDLSNDSSTDRTNNFERFKQLFSLLISNGGTILFNSNNDISEDNVSDNDDNTTAAELGALIGKINKVFKPEQKSRSGGRKSKKRKRRKRRKSRKKKTIKKSRKRKNKRKRLRKKTKRK
tara:strand:+ start:2503 stop:2979 length:477 start_codon:yes stop_codon:yes gene_type:complete